MIKPQKAEMLRMTKNDENFGKDLSPTNRADRRKLTKLVTQHAKRTGVVPASRDAIIQALKTVAGTQQ